MLRSGILSFENDVRNFAFFAAECEATLKMYGNYLYLGQTTEQKSETNFNPEYMAIKYDFKYRERQISILGEGKGFRNISSNVMAII